MVAILTKAVNLKDDVAGNASGWTPRKVNGIHVTLFTISESSVTANSLIFAVVRGGTYMCGVSKVNPGTSFDLVCVDHNYTGPVEGTSLNYVIIEP